MDTEIVKLLWLKTATISRILDNSLGAIHGIGFSEYMVLMNLAEAPNKVMRRTDLALAVCRTGSGITRMLNPMEKIGLVTKESSERDGRVSLVKLTPTGLKIFEEATQTLDQKSATVVQNLDRKQVKTLLTLLRTLD